MATPRKTHRGRIKTSLSLEIIRKRYRKDPRDKVMTKAIYEAYSKLNRAGYYEILSRTPETKTPGRAIQSGRWQPGFLKRHIKLVTRRRPPYVYQEVDVPGKYSHGSHGWRAWVIIQSYHLGRKHPGKIYPTRHKVLKIPYPWPGAKPRLKIIGKGENKVAVTRDEKGAIWAPKVEIGAPFRPKPWFPQAWAKVNPEFDRYLREALAKQPTTEKRERYG